jgi:hypothetical protein
MTRDVDIRYCERLPSKPIPAGRYLAHNHVKPAPRLGLNGFRAWTQAHKRDLVRCYCDFGGCQNAALHKHYRVALPFAKPWPADTLPKRHVQ